MSLLVALIENIQREDLTVVEEAKSYKMIIDNLKLTQEELAKKIGKSRPHISNTLRILTLSDDILDLVDTKLVSMGHLKVLVNIEDKKKLQKIIDEIVAEPLGGAHRGREITMNNVAKAVKTALDKLKKQDNLKQKRREKFVKMT